MPKLNSKYLNTQTLSTGVAQGFYFTAPSTSFKIKISYSNYYSSWKRCCLLIDNVVISSTSINSQVACLKDKYRFGFNGKEKDDEVKGEGNQQNYGMRIYDPRLGKFLSLDPLHYKFPWNSVYAFAENDVVSAIDLDGLEKYIIHLSDEDGQTFLKINDKRENHHLGLFKYEGEDQIYLQFQRDEERSAEKKLNDQIGKDIKTTGVSFKYKLNIKFRPSSSKILNELESENELNWLADRLKNNPNLKVNLSANNGWTDPNGNPIPASPLDEETRDADNNEIVSGKEFTLRRANSVKKELTDKFGVKEGKLSVKAGKSLSGASNRNVEIEFKKR